MPMVKTHDETVDLLKEEVAPAQKKSSEKNVAEGEIRDGELPEVLDPGEVALVCEECDHALIRQQTEDMVWYCDDCGGRRQPVTMPFNARGDSE